MKKYKLNTSIKLLSILMGIFLLCMELAIIFAPASYNKDLRYYVVVFFLPFVILIILSICTIHIELYNDYFIHKQLQLKAKILFKDIVEITSQIVLFRLYFIRYYHTGVLIKRTIFPMNKMYDFLNELKKRSPDLILEERIKIKINELKSKGKIK